jgi:hypothetical protein
VREAFSGREDDRHLIEVLQEKHIDGLVDSEDDQPRLESNDLAMTTGWTILMPSKLPEVMMRR